MARSAAFHAKKRRLRLAQRARRRIAQSSPPDQELASRLAKMERRADRAEGRLARERIKSSQLERTADRLTEQGSEYQIIANNAVHGKRLLVEQVETMAGKLLASERAGGCARVRARFTAEARELRLRADRGTDMLADAFVNARRAEASGTNPRCGYEAYRLYSRAKTILCKHGGRITQAQVEEEFPEEKAMLCRALHRVALYSLAKREWAFEPLPAPVERDYY